MLSPLRFHMSEASANKDQISRVIGLKCDEINLILAGGDPHMELHISL